MKRLAFVVALTAGCAAGDSTVSYDNHLAEMEARVDALDAESEAHSKAIAAQTSLEKMIGVEADHYARCVGFRDDMNARMDAIHECRDGMGMPDLDAGLGADLAGLSAEVQRHLHAMWTAPSEDSARLEEAGHRYAMSQLTGSMHEHLTNMSGDAPRMGMCSNEPPMNCTP